MHAETSLHLYRTAHACGQKKGPLEGNKSPIEKADGVNAMAAAGEAAGEKASVRKEWVTPKAVPISRFSILDLGPTPGTVENSTYSNKSL